MIKKPLTYEDIKKLKYSCRPGIITGIFLAFCGSFILLVQNIWTRENVSESMINNTYGFIVIILITAFVVGYLMNRKYRIDLRNNEKELHVKVISKKEQKTDYEAGSGTIPGIGMKGYQKYSVIVDNVRHYVNEELFMNCQEGDEIVFHYTPKSQKLLKIELKK